MLPYLLTRPNRLRLAQAFASVPSVDISIDCVIEDQMGVAFVDTVDDPQFFMVEQDHFFCYFAGDLMTAAGRAFLANIPKGRFLMAGSDGWQDAVQSHFGEQAMPIKRYSYSSDSLSLDHLKNLAAANPNTPNVKRIDAALAGAEIPYMEIGALESFDDFVERGIGFSLIKDNVSLGVAYSSLVCSDGIEISIVVDPDHYRQGIATALACQLLIWCLEHSLSPHWDAANEESCSLAEKLGYTKIGEYTAIFLKPDKS
jgi:GNAT superfamily N-acetyltransferase